MGTRRVKLRPAPIHMLRLKVLRTTNVQTMNGQSLQAERWKFQLGH